MIRVSAETEAGRALALVVDRPGQLDAEALGQLLWRPKILGTENYLAVRASIQQNQKLWSKNASGLLHRLQQQGLIEKMRPPGIGPGYEPGLESKLEKPLSELLSKLVRKLPATMLAWVGSAPCGQTQRAIRELAEASVVILPSQRFPTQKGIELVSSWRASGGKN